MQVRTPAVAGAFYPARKDELTESIQSCFSHSFGPGSFPPAEKTSEIIGVICPHAGYMYSGPVASNSFYAMSYEGKKMYIIVGPNHWGIGSSVASVKDCMWETPLGGVEVESESAEKLSKIFKKLELDFFSHTREHSIEVQIPMLQNIFTDFKILPISLIDQSKQTAKELGAGIAKLCENTQAMIIGSSDFTHYEPHDVAFEQDHALIEPILNLDIDEFYEILENRQVSACGYGAIASTMVACKKLGATKGKLLRYCTTGDISGDKTSVVGYASIVFT
ncbi:MAG: MEMO1 family protein [Nitrosopumilaceae archaeon]|nr:MEMO1 family protein [Nitrosopumilaceae archaeon]NIU00499.1 MEMO1 family protein [Nitrosopumilaceae archaeon]NIU86882.1 MEMO1 family protein [Nitrosopumilaceae archaeon]NIV65562.1 MEMO1 family protein [Nitrosopumilaceae archaeon]NIX61101.1 MEMO1 family protein [Nitrosopumilaceae archaeon]